MLASKKVWMAEQIPTTEYKNSSKENFHSPLLGGFLSLSDPQMGFLTVLSLSWML